MINPVYNLPQLRFVGGETQSFLFNLRTPGGSTFNAVGCSAAIALINYTNKTGLPVLVKSMSLREDEEGYYSSAYVELSPSETVNLQGRYIYQISIRDSAGETEIPGQGLMDITRNIHPGFIT